MGRALRRGQFGTAAILLLALFAVVVGSLAHAQQAIQERLLGDHLKPVTAEEVSAVVAQHPEDPWLLYAASQHFQGERRAELLQRAAELEKQCEVVAAVQEMIRFAPRGFVFPDRLWSEGGEGQVKFLEAAERVPKLDPENALAHISLAAAAFQQGKPEEGFARVDEALTKPTLRTYDVEHLRARFRLLDALGRDGFLKYTVMAATSLPDTASVRFLGDKLAERAQGRLEAGDTEGALADCRRADRLADLLLLTRPLFRIREWVAQSVKQKAAEISRKVYQAREDAPAAAGAALLVHAYEARFTYLVDIGRDWPPVISEVSQFESARTGWTRYSEAALKEQLDQPSALAASLRGATEAVERYFALPEFEAMMKLYLEAMLTDGAGEAREKANEFRRRSSLPQEEKRVKEALQALTVALKEVPETPDYACTRRLKQLGLAIAIYLAEHDDELPQSLSDVRQYVGREGEATFLCPLSGEQYEYRLKGVQSKAITNWGLTVAAYDTAPVHAGRRIVLFLDGHVEKMPESAFQSLLSMQETAGAEARVEADCKGHLKQLGLAFMMYAQDHGKVLPDTLEPLVRYTQDPKVLTCPASGKEYVYVGKGMDMTKVVNPAFTIVACDAEPVHRGRRTVLFLDGHVETISDDALRDRLTDEQKKVLLPILGEKE